MRLIWWMRKTRFLINYIKLSVCRVCADVASNKSLTIQTQTTSIQIRHKFFPCSFKLRIFWSIRSHCHSCNNAQLNRIVVLRSWLEVLQMHRNHWICCYSTSLTGKCFKCSFKLLHRDHLSFASGPANKCHCVVVHAVIPLPTSAQSAVYTECTLQNTFPTHHRKRF